MSRLRYLLALTFALCIIGPRFAYADYVYTFQENGTAEFSFTVPNLLTPGTIPTVTPTTPITGGTFTFNAGAVGMFSNSTSTCFAFADVSATGDNLACGAGGFNDLMFVFVPQNLYSLGVGSYSASSSVIVGNAPQINGLVISQAASAVPEPSSLMLLGTGAVGFLGPIRRKMFLHTKR